MQPSVRAVASPALPALPPLVTECTTHVTRLQLPFASNPPNVGWASTLPTQVHWDLPKSLEHLLQEAGRAGRDGLPALSRVHCTPRRRVQLSGGRGGDTALPLSRSILSYCAERKCRRVRLLQHFGETRELPTVRSPSCCDCCDRVLASYLDQNAARAGEASASPATAPTPARTSCTAQRCLSSLAASN
eukprot:6188067-Pleurochrysis_carterae.AAC.7